MICNALGFVQDHVTHPLAPVYFSNMAQQDICAMIHWAHLAKKDAEHALKRVLVVFDFVLLHVALRQESPAELDAFGLVSPRFRPYLVNGNVTCKGAFGGTGEEVDIRLGPTVVEFLALGESFRSVTILQLPRGFAESQIVVFRSWCWNRGGGIVRIAARDKRGRVR